MPQYNDRYLQAAAECLESARATPDEETRASLLALAQKWIDLTQHRPDGSALLAALEVFNDSQIKK